MNLPVRTVSIVQASSAERELYQRYLLADSSCDYRLLWVESVRAAVDLCLNRSIDVMLLGCSLSAVDSLAFLKNLNDLPVANSKFGKDSLLADRVRIAPPAVIMIAAAGDLTVAVGALKLGAHDYLVQQNLTPELLQSAIGSAVEQTRLRRQSLADEDRFRAAIDNMLDCVSICTAIRDDTGQIIDFRFDYLNPGALASNQMTAADFGRSVSKMFPAAWQNGQLAEYARVVETGIPLAKEDLIYADIFGSEYLTKTYDVRVCKLADGFIAAWRDITERKQTESALLESERKFSAVFDQTFELLGLLNLDGVVQEVNQSALDAIAADQRDILGKNVWETPWFSHSAELQCQIKDSLALAVQGEFIRYEMYFPDRRGETLFIDFSLKPIFDAAGRVVSTIAQGSDITERKRAEAALVENEERFRTLADNISQLAWMADADGGIFWYNRRCFEYLGTTLEQMQGWGWQQVHHPEHVDRVVEWFRGSLASGETWEDTFPLRGADGNYRWFLSRAIPIRDAQGQIVRWFGTNTDITDLQSAQAALEDRNRELDSFVHIVAHDLKAPLRAIRNLAEWIAEDLAESLTPDTQQQMLRLQSRVERMSGLIDGLLNYARVGIVDSTSELVILPELLLEVVDSLAPPSTFTIDIPPHLPTIHANRLLLSQVFANLLGNAIKYHERVDGMVSVAVVDCGDFYEFAVADNGPGIAPNYLEQIFTIFHTGKPQNRQDSTGIGLAIVKKIVEAEAGKIWVESEVAKGSTFYFTWRK